MRTVKNVLATLTSGALLTGMILSFNACTEQSPLTSESTEATPALGKRSLDKSTSLDDGLTNDNAYPQSATGTYVFKSAWNKYQGGNIQLPNGSTFHIVRGALTPPSGTLSGADVTITMVVEKDEVNNALTFTFGPPAEIWLDYSDLNVTKATLYLIDTDGDYIEQTPYDIDTQG